MTRVFIIGAVFMALVVVVVQQLETVGRVPPAAAMVKPNPPLPAAAAPAPANSRTMVIKAGSGGHFEVDARVDGRRLAMIVDTGASQIALRESDAARAGFHPTQRDYSIKVMTANGEGRAARVDLGRVEVGDIVVRDVVALVMPDEVLAVNLLGMSFLSRVRWSHERGNLVLEQ
jgi:aspartyl protease family protein